MSPTVPVSRIFEGASGAVEAAVLQSACETLDMLKSGTRRAGVAVREK